MLDSYSGRFPNFVFFIRQFFEVVFPKYFGQFDCATMSSSYSLEYCVDELFGIALKLVKDHEARNVDRINRRIIQPKIVICAEWLDTVNLSNDPIDNKLEQNCLKDARI